MHMYAHELKHAKPHANVSMPVYPRSCAPYTRMHICICVSMPCASPCTRKQNAYVHAYACMPVCACMCNEIQHVHYVCACHNVCTCAWMYACGILKRMHARMHTCTHACASIPMQACAHACMLVTPCVCVYTIVISVLCVKTLPETVPEPVRETLPIPN